MTLINTSRTNQHLPYIIDTTWANHNPLDWQRNSRSYVHTHCCQKMSRKYLSWRHCWHKRQLIVSTWNSNSRNRARHSVLTSWLHTLTTKCVINTINSVFGSWVSQPIMNFSPVGEHEISLLWSRQPATDPPAFYLGWCHPAPDSRLYKIDFNLFISSRSSFKVSWSMFYMPLYSLLTCPGFLLLLYFE